MENLSNIEEIEKKVLFNLGWIFKNSLDDFSTSIDRSLRYLDKIVLPIIMASKEDRAYNPFSEIIEKYVQHILIRKFEKEEYNLLPLGYSADLTLENEQHILSIDIKTANIDNPSDFRETVNVGINQMTHVAKLRLNRQFLPPPYFVYPTIPPFYEMNDGIKKLILTYCLMFIYPSYRNLIEDIRKDYKNLLNFFNSRLKKVLIPVVMHNFNVSRQEAIRILEAKPERSKYSRDELITESLIRGIFIHGQEKENIVNSLEIFKEDYNTVSKFFDKLKKFTNDLREKDIKPIAIIAISLPNGLLKDSYIDKFVSGKDYSKSARYHYEDGIFRIIKEKTEKEFPRVIFVDLNKSYLDDLRRYFDRITVLDYELRIL